MGFQEDRAAQNWQLFLLAPGALLKVQTCTPAVAGGYEAAGSDEPLF